MDQLRLELGLLDESNESNVGAFERFCSLDMKKYNNQDQLQHYALVLQRISSIRNSVDESSAQRIGSIYSKILQNVEQLIVSSDMDDVAPQLIELGQAGDFHLELWTWKLLIKQLAIVPARQTARVAEALSRRCLQIIKSSCLENAFPLFQLLLALAKIFIKNGYFDSYTASLFIEVCRFETGVEEIDVRLGMLVHTIASHWVSKGSVDYADKSLTRAFLGRLVRSDSEEKLLNSFLEIGLWSKASLFSVLPISKFNGLGLNDLDLVWTMYSLPRKFHALPPTKRFSIVSALLKSYVTSFTDRKIASYYALLIRTCIGVLNDRDISDLVSTLSLLMKLAVAPFVSQNEFRKQVSTNIMQIISKNSSSDILLNILFSASVCLEPEQFEKFLAFAEMHGDKNCNEFLIKVIRMSKKYTEVDKACRLLVKQDNQLYLWYALAVTSVNGQHSAANTILSHINSGESHWTLEFFKLISLEAIARYSAELSIFENPKLVPYQNQLLQFYQRKLPENLTIEEESEYNAVFSNIDKISPIMRHLYQIKSMIQNVNMEKLDDKTRGLFCYINDNVV